jgi:hypothetical protein
MVDRWQFEDAVEELDLDEEFVGLAGSGRGRKARKKSPVKTELEFPADEREDKRKKRRWEAPPHKRVSDYDPA